MPANPWPGSQELSVLGGIKKMVFGQDINYPNPALDHLFLGEIKMERTKLKEYIVENICWFCFPNIHSSFF